MEINFISIQDSLKTVNNNDDLVKPNFLWILDSTFTNRNKLLSERVLDPLIKFSTPAILFHITFINPTGIQITFVCLPCESLVPVPSEFLNSISKPNFDKNITNFWPHKLLSNMREAKILPQIPYVIPSQTFLRLMLNPSDVQSCPLYQKAS